jgi:T5orf172 domain
MSSLQQWVAYGVSPCREAGHELRVRSGHCVQCKPANLSYLRRYDEDGEVYVAGSASGRVVKVGTSANSEERVGHLNSYVYGGQSDWQRLFVTRVQNAGRVEADAQQALAAHAAIGQYFKDGAYIECRELFACSSGVAIAAVKAASAGPRAPFAKEK